MILCVIGICSILAGVIQTITGFGSGIVLIAVLVRYYSMVTAPAINTSVTLGLTVALSWKYRKSIDLRLIAVPVIVYMAASVGVISIVEYINLNTLAILFGVFLVALSVYFLLYADKVTVKTGRLSAVLCSFVSGIFSGLFGIGGPVISLYMLVATNDRESYVANLQLLFALTNVANMCARIYRGIYTVDLIPVTVLGIIGINLGKWIGISVADRLNTEWIKRIVYLFVGVSGVTTLIQHLT